MDTAEYRHNRAVFKELMQNAFSHADNHQRPQDSQETRNALVLEYCRRAFSAFPLMPPCLEYTVKEMIENPYLITANIRASRDHVQKKGHCFRDPELLKCSVRAAALRRDGNLLYMLKKFDDALEKYNESICCAPNDSEELGIGYANRSVIYYEQEEYELALANIVLAKKHNYPERLMPKLRARETNCHGKTDEEAISERPKRFRTLAFNSEPNPRIPFLSKGISARLLPIYGNSLVAEKDFKVQDVILQEKPLKTSVGLSHKFIHCNHCLSGNLLHLIPCPNCTSAMFCNEECLQEGFKTHRFECGATANLVRMNDFLLGPRMFFHGLTLFDDDVDKLMAFCQANKETDKRSFFDLDYSNYDPLEEFKVFLGIRNRYGSVFIANVQMLAAVFYTMFMEIPLVQSLFTTEAQKEFMLQCFFDFIYLTMSMGILRDPIRNINGQLFPIASICNHSCDPNTLALNYGGGIKFVVLRPIRCGEQILISYGSRYNQNASLRSLWLNSLGFSCACDVCHKDKRSTWLANYEKKDSIPSSHWWTVDRMIAGADVTGADKLNALQQFVHRHAAAHPQKDFVGVLLIYSAALKACHKLAMEAEMRKKIGG